METQYRLLITTIGIILSISIASAVSISYAPSQVNINENVDIVISGIGLYALEVEIPQEFKIVSDPSNGVRTENVYKTVATGSLRLILSPIKTGNYVIAGNYTDGSGVKKLNTKIIEVKKIQYQQSCPICPINSEWSNCENSKKIRLTYLCSSSTGYICVKNTEASNCNVEQIMDDNKGVVNCEVGWICKDNNNLAYQSSDCSMSSVQICNDGCENKKCKTNKQINNNYTDDNLTITIISESAKGYNKTFLTKIKNVIISILNFLKFWN